MQTFLTAQLTLLTTTEPFTQDSGPCLPEISCVPVATALDYINLLFKPEIFSHKRNHTNNYAIFKQVLTGYYHTFILAYVDLE